MNMGCKPLDKLRQKRKKGLWSPDEDQKLKNYIVSHGLGCWSSVPINAGLQRNGKSCRLRWINYLRPGLKQGPFSKEDEEKILRLHGMLGNKWSQIAEHLPGRTDNEIKNYWHSYLKKNIANMGETDTQTKAEYKSPSSGEEESSHSSSKMTPQTSSFASFENTEGSLTDTDQSFARMEFPREAGISNLPKVLFAEWLSLDQFCGQFLGNSGNPLISKNTLDQHNSNFQDRSMQGLLLEEGMFHGNIHHGLNDSSVDGMYRPSLKFEDQMLQSGFFEFNQGEVNITSDGAYI